MAQVSVGILLLVLVAAPLWMWVFYCLAREPEEVRVAYGLSVTWQRRRCLYWTQLAGGCLLGSIISAAAVALICAGSENAAAQRLLALA